MTDDPRDPLHLFVVYRSPRDYPGEYVVREQVALHNGQVAVAPHLAAKGSTLEEVRRQIFKLPGGHNLVCIARSPEDEPQIVEVWL